MESWKNFSCFFCMNRIFLFSRAVPVNGFLVSSFACNQLWMYFAEIQGLIEGFQKMHQNANTSLIFTYVHTGAD